MPTEVQIIDGFERLREAFGEANPDMPAQTQDTGPIAPPSPERIVEAWLQAHEGRGAETPPQRRRLRALVRAIMDGSPPADQASAEDLALIEKGQAIPARLGKARANGLGFVQGKPSKSTPLADQAAAWRKLLPGLTGLRSWHLLERLGYPVLLPLRPVERFLWRLGLIETAPGKAIRGELVQEAAQKVASLSGMTPRLVHRLILWHVGEEPSLRGGRLCLAKPHCSVCPLKGPCTWARFRNGGVGEAGQEEAKGHVPLEPLYHQIAADHQASLREMELLAVILQGGVGGQGALELAEALMRRFGNLKGLEQATLAELTQVRGISRSRAGRLKAALELGRRFATHGLAPGDPITCSDDIWQAYRGRFGNLAQEHFVVILLDTKNRVLHDVLVSKGTLNGSHAHPREVFKQAVRHSAGAIILLHNHPSGDPTPSPDDRDVTQRLREAGEVLGIRVLDHVILGADDYYSFTDDE